MKITLAILNILLLGWLIIAIPIVRVATEAAIGSRYAELSKAGVINQDKLNEFQKQTQAPFRPDNRRSIGAWLMDDEAYLGLLIIPCGGLLALNTIYLLISSRKGKKAVEPS